MFLGFTNFYQYFINRYLRVAQGLTNILKGSVKSKILGPFYIILEAIKAFIVLKQAFTQAPILRYFNLALYIQVETNMSNFTLLGILLQLYRTNLIVRQHLIIFFSRKLTPIKCRYKTYNKELIAIVQSFDYQDYYLYST